MAKDLPDAHLDKRQRKTFQYLVHPAEHSSTNSWWKTQKDSVDKNQEFMPQIAENKKRSSSILFDESHF